jgi:hypothetical protein
VRIILGQDRVSSCWGSALCEIVPYVQQQNTLVIDEKLTTSVRYQYRTGPLDVTTIRRSYLSPSISSLGFFFFFLFLFLFFSFTFSVHEYSWQRGRCLLLPTEDGSRKVPTILPDIRGAFPSTISKRWLGSNRGFRRYQKTVDVTAVLPNLGTWLPCTYIYI